MWRGSAYLGTSINALTRSSFLIANVLRARHPATESSRMTPCARINHPAEKAAEYSTGTRSQRRRSSKCVSSRPAPNGKWCVLYTRQNIGSIKQLALLELRKGLTVE